MHFFHVFFTEWLHVFDRCTKTVCARQNPKTNESSTMNYLSYDIILITVVLVVLQITTWENLSNSKKICSSLMATSWLLRIVLQLTTFDLAYGRLWPSKIKLLSIVVIISSLGYFKQSVNVLFLSQRSTFNH